MKNQIFLTPARLRLLLNDSSIKNILECYDVEMFEILADNNVLDKTVYNHALYYLLSNDLFENPGCESFSIDLANKTENKKSIDFLGQEKFKKYFDMNLILKEAWAYSELPTHTFCLYRKDINHPMLKDSLNQIETKQEIVALLTKFYLQNEVLHTRGISAFLKNEDFREIIDVPKIKQIFADFRQTPIKKNFVDLISKILFGNGRNECIFLDNDEVITHLLAALSGKKFFIDNFLGEIFNKIREFPKLKKIVSERKFVYWAAEGLRNLIIEYIADGDRISIRKDKRYKPMIDFLKNCMFCQDSLAPTERQLLREISKKNKHVAEDISAIENEILKNIIKKEIKIPKKNQLQKI